MPDTVRTPVFTRYELLEELGSGGMGAVYKARQKFVGRLVAFKVLPPGLREDAEALQRFKREAAALGRLKHPHLVSVFDAGVEGSFPYLAMEYIEGKNLRQVLQEHQWLSVEETIRLGIEMAEALDYVQGRGLVHRDVKPSNIMVTPEGAYVLTDFGIAFAEAMPRITQGAMGTPEFMSPEQAEGQTLDIRSDLYSLGVVLYECLAGAMPFERRDDSLTSLSSLIHQVLHAAPTPIETRRPDTPAWLAEVVQRCMAKKPEDRFQTGADLADALRRDTAPQAPVPPPPPQPKAAPTPTPEPPAPEPPTPEPLASQKMPPPTSPPSQPPATGRSGAWRPWQKKREDAAPATAPSRRAPHVTAPPPPQAEPLREPASEAKKLPAKPESKKAPDASPKNPRARTAFKVWLVLGLLLCVYLLIDFGIPPLGESLVWLNGLCLTPAMTGALTTLFSRSKKKKSKVGRGIVFGVLFGGVLSLAVMAAIAVQVLGIPLDVIPFDEELRLYLMLTSLASVIASALVTGVVLGIRSLFSSS